MSNGIKLGKTYDDVFDMLKDGFPENAEYAADAFKEHQNQFISQVLYMMRMRKGLTQAEVAELMGVTQSAIAKLEDRGNQVRINDVIKYANVLGYDSLIQFKEKGINMSKLLRWHLEVCLH